MSLNNLSRDSRLTYSSTGVQGQDLSAVKMANSAAPHMSKMTKCAVIVRPFFANSAVLCGVFVVKKVRCC